VLNLASEWEYTFRGQGLVTAETVKGIFLRLFIERSSFWRRGCWGMMSSVTGEGGKIGEGYICTLIE